MIVNYCSLRPVQRDSVAQHQHNHLEWHYVVAGRCGFRLGQQRMTICSGDFFLVAPGLGHGLDMASDHDWLVQYIIKSNLDDNLAQAWQDRYGSSACCHIGHQHDLFSHLSMALVTGVDTWTKLTQQHRFAALVCGLLADQPQPSQRHPAVAQALAMMHQRLRQSLSLDQLATTIGLDKHYFTRLFKQEMGQPPLRYFCHLQMQVATTLLRDRQRSIADIAEDLGYHDPFHFSRVFRRAYGQSPRQWRSAEG